MRKAVLSVLLTVALGATYIWLGILGERPLARYINASVTIPDSHGLLVGTSVCVRGFKIGEITALHRSSEGVRIEFRLDSNHRVPISSRLKVESLTALETYLDFMPPDLEKPYIEDGAVISLARTSVPLTVPEVFALLNRLTRSISSADLGGVLQTVAQATDVSPTAVSNLATAGAMVNQLIRAQMANIKALSANYGQITEQLDQLNEGIAGLSSTSVLLTKARRLLESYKTLMEGAEMPISLRNSIIPFLENNGSNITSILSKIGMISEPLVPVSQALGDVANIDLAALLSQLLRSVSEDGLALTVSIPPR